MSSEIQQLINGEWSRDPQGGSRAQSEYNALIQAGDAAIRLAAAWEQFWQSVRLLESIRAIPKEQQCPPVPTDTPARERNCTYSVCSCAMGALPHCPRAVPTDGDTR